MNELIVQIAEAVVPILIGWLLVKLVTLTDQYIGEAKRRRIIEIVENAVLAVEQVAPQLAIKGKEKLDLATEWASLELKRLGFKIEPEQIHVYIERVLEKLKQ